MNPALAKALRARLTELGLVAAIGPAGAARLIALVRAKEQRLPERTRERQNPQSEWASQRRRIANAAQTGLTHARTRPILRLAQKLPSIGGAVHAFAGNDGVPNVSVGV